MQRTRSLWGSSIWRGFFPLFRSLAVVEFSLDSAHDARHVETLWIMASLEFRSRRIGGMALCVVLVYYLSCAGCSLECHSDVFRIKTIPDGAVQLWDVRT